MGLQFCFRYLAKGLTTKDKREIFDLCQELEDLIDEYNRVCHKPYQLISYLQFL